MQIVFDLNMEKVGPSSLFKTSAVVRTRVHPEMTASFCSFELTVLIAFRVIRALSSL
jgi:hypothetical protein